MDPVLKNIDGTEKLCMGGFGALVPATHTLPLSLHPEVIIQKEQSRWNVGSEGTFPHSDVLTCTLLFHSAHALEPPEHTTQVSDTVLEGDFLVLAGFRILQQLPHVYLGLFLLRLHLPNRGEPLPGLIAAHWPLKTRKVGVWYRFFGSALKALFKA